MFPSFPRMESVEILKKSPKKRNKMSVTDPADSAPPQQILQVCDNITDMNQIGSWAQLMEEEEFNDTGLFGDDGTDEADGGENSASLSPERRRHIPNEGPFRAQITNISSTHVEEELIYYFGGERLIKHVDFRKQDGNAEFEFFTRDGLMHALKKHDADFKGRTLKVFVRQNRESLARGVAAGRQLERRSHYDSQGSLGSEKHHGRFDKGNRNYGTLPPGGLHDRRSTGGRGGYHQHHQFNDNNRSFRAPRNGPPHYDRQHSHPNHHHRYENEHNGGPLQRSGSYQHNRSGNHDYYHQKTHRDNNYHQHNQPASISARSRTESRSTTNFDNFSRTSSRMSVAEEPAKVVRKPSANPFGDAKPVDTQTKLLELEKRLAEKQESSEDVVETAAAESSSSGNNHQKYHQYYKKKPNSLYEANSPPQQQQQQQQQQSFEQGAPPGSVVIKKRESMDQQKDDEIPPVDPIQYPPQEHDHPPPVSSASSASHRGSSASRGGGRPTMKPYSARGAHHLQKSATLGSIDKSSRGDGSGDGVGGGAGDDRKPPHPQQQQQQQRRYQDRGYRNEPRRASLSGSEGDHKSRGGGGGKRGGGARGRGGAPRGTGRRSDGDGRNKEGLEQQQKVHNSEESKALLQQEVVKEETNVKSGEEALPPPPPSAPKQSSEDVQPKSSELEEANSTSAATTTPKKKKEKKKEKRKEAKQMHMTTNKFAALLNCSQDVNN